MSDDYKIKLYNTATRQYEEWTADEIAESIVPAPPMTDEEKRAFGEFIRKHKREMRRKRTWWENIKHDLYYRHYLPWKYRLQDWLR